MRDLILALDLTLALRIHGQRRTSDDRLEGRAEPRATQQSEESMASTGAAHP